MKKKSNQSLSYETELAALAMRLADLDAARDAKRALKIKHVELLAKLAQHFAGKDKWIRLGTSIVDDNECNGSFPPDDQWTDHSSPALMEIRDCDYSAEASEGGFYHACTVGTRDAGLFISRDGTLYGAAFDGTCHFGQFPAHPGICARQITVNWEPLPYDDISNDDFEAAITALRKLIS